ncbi:MAG: hypothetical protein L0241_03955 [Planctomycetia bacterium]|nr:hypothetical protein [Planctomycetia bacterium]
MRVTLCGLAAVVMLAASTAHAQAAEKVSDLLVWVPGQSNLALFVDVDAIRKSDIAKKQKWGTGKDPTSGLDSLPPGITRLVIAAQFDPGSGVSWEVLVAELRKPITDADLLKGTGGTLDNVGGKNAILTKKKQFVANLGPGVVGAYQPANRQGAGRWLRGADGKVSPQLSSYLKQAGATVVGNTPVLLALDTTDMFDPALVKAALAKTSTLKGKDAVIGPIADLFGQMHGLTLSIHVTDKLTGDIQLDFGAAADPLKDVAKPLLLELLDRLGMHCEEMNKWTAAIRGKSITFGGPLTQDGARDILSPFLRPFLGEVDQTEPGPATEQTKAQVSLKYYQAVHKKMSEVRKTSNPTFAKLASMFNAAARHIDDLPILNVDDELLDWGQSIATTFRSMAIVAQTAGGMMTLADANKAMVQVSSPNYYTGSVGGYGNGYYGGYGWGYNYAVPSGTTSTTTISNYGQVSNLQFMTKEKEADYRRNTWKAMDTATADVRRKMVKKYNIEF